MKKILAIFLLLIVICIVALASLAIFIDPNKLKPIIVAEVMKKTGYKMAIEGDLSWSLFPRLTIDITKMTLTAPSEQVAFLELENIKVATTLSRLIHGKDGQVGDVWINKVRLLNIHAEDAHIGLQWRDQLLTLQPIVANLYQGALSGTAHGRNLVSLPHWDFDVVFNQIQLKPLLQDVNDGHSKLNLSGAALVKLRGVTEGNNKEQLLKHLDGNLEADVTNGIVEGIDINYFILTADALISKQPLTTPTNDLKQTAFDHFSSTVIIKNGVADTNNILLTSSTFTVKGQGNVDLLSQALRLQFQINPMQAKWEVPVTVSGTTTNPDVKLDLLAIQKIMAAQELNKIKTKAREQIQKHVPGKAGEFLQNLLGK